MRAAVGRPHNAYVCQRNTGSGISHNFAVNNYYTSMEPTERTRKPFGAVRYVYEKFYVYNVGESEIMGTQSMDTSIHNRPHPAQLCICFEMFFFMHTYTQTTLAIRVDMQISSCFRYGANFTFIIPSASEE